MGRWVEFTTIGGVVITGATFTARDRRSPSMPKGYAAPPGTGPAGETCKSCTHCVRREGGDKNYYKCALLEGRWTNSCGTDIRLKSPACRFWQKESQNAEPVI